MHDPIPPPPPRIEIRRLTKTFRRAAGTTITPVDDVSLTVGHDEIVVLLGPSGCGKTTLLRCVAGLERPDAGEILIDGRIVFSSARRIFLPPDRRGLSMIFQSFALWPHMTVFQNVAYPLEAHGVGRTEIKRRVEEVLALVAIDGLGAQYPGQISGGQQQRVALARALVANSTVVLFDEPLSSVDAKVREQLRYELLRMQRQIGFSGLYVTHDQSEAMELGNRIAVLESGRIAALGAPQEIYERPPSEYVANFLGVANVWRGEIVERQDAVVKVRTRLGEIVAHAPEAVALGDVSVVVRPEKFRLLATTPVDVENAFAVRIETRVFAGPYVEYVVRGGSVDARVFVYDDALAQLPPGGTAWLCVDPTNVRLIAPAPLPEAAA